MIDMQLCGYFILHVQDVQDVACVAVFLSNSNKILDC